MNSTEVRIKGTAFGSFWRSLFWRGVGPVDKFACVKLACSLQCLLVFTVSESRVSGWLLSGRLCGSPLSLCGDKGPRMWGQ